LSVQQNMASPSLFAGGKKGATPNAWNVQFACRTVSF